MPQARVCLRTRTGTRMRAWRIFRCLAGEELPVVAIDADINHHLAAALGAGGSRRR
jgi:hypothetical protein